MTLNSGIGNRQRHDRCRKCQFYEEDDNPLSEHWIKSEISATVWKIEVATGDRVSEGDTLVILESMKMEIPVTAPFAGVVGSILVSEGATISAEEPLVAIIQ
jgi:urea carboxylase